MIEAKNISYDIQGKYLIKNCSLKIEPGKLTAVVGPNGAGKSTLLKILTGETRGFDGIVLYNGEDNLKINSLCLSKLRAVLLQDTHVNFPFTVEQIIEIGRYSYQDTKSEKNKIINEVMMNNFLKPYSGRVYQTLSGGERQRVQLGRVMAQIWNKTDYAKYLLLDEPISGLDIFHQHALLDTARALLMKNIGVMAIIHDLNLAASYSDNMILMKEGEIVKCGITPDVFNEENIEMTFDCPVSMIKDLETGKNIVVSRSRKNNINSIIH